MHSTLRDATTPSGPSGGDDWIKWSTGAGFAGGTAYFKYRYDQSQRSKLTRTVPSSQDNTYVKPPVIYPSNGR
mgnify:CR=1 FL=1